VVSSVLLVADSGEELKLAPGSTATTDWGSRTDVPSGIYAVHVALPVVSLGLSELPSGIGCTLQWNGGSYTVP
jgi:hypothetical protein